MSGHSGGEGRSQRPFAETEHGGEHVGRMSTTATSEHIRVPGTMLSAWYVITVLLSQQP